MNNQLSVATALAALLFSRPAQAQQSSPEAATLLAFPQSGGGSSAAAATQTELSLALLPDGSLAASLELELLPGVVALALRQQALPQLGSFSAELHLFPGAGEFVLVLTGGAEDAARATLTLELP
jgi:hypothetical protein